MDILENTIGKSYTGGCHCGAVKIKMTGPLYPFVACHCSDCLRTSGTSWAAAKLGLDQLEFTSGEENIDWYKSSDNAARGCCKTCHANMFFRLDGSDLISIAPGMFDNYDGLEIKGHIYRKSLPDVCQNWEARPDIDDEFYSLQEQD